MRNITILLAALLLAGCASAPKRAQRHLAKAVALDPRLLQPGDTLEVPGGVATVPALPLLAVDVDSLEAACLQLAEALRAERDIYAAALLTATPDQPLPVATPPVMRAADAVRRAACQYAPFYYDHELFTLTAAGGDTPGLRLVVKPRKASAPCPPVVKNVVVVKEGVATWYRTFFWCFVGLVVLAFLKLARLARVWPG